MTYCKGPEKSPRGDRVFATSENISLCDFFQAGVYGCLMYFT